MNVLSSLSLAGCFLLLGINRISSIKKNTCALNDALSFITMVKNNIRFSMMDYESLIECGKKEGYSYISFENGVTLSKYAAKKAQADFLCFINKIGTTDETGQLMLCDEYLERFKGYYNESASNEKGRVKVVGALSVLSVVCAFLLGG
jgi:hypothetical protein